LEKKLILNNYFRILGTNILKPRTNNIFCEQKIKHREQIIMYNEQNNNHHEHLIV